MTRIITPLSEINKMVMQEIVKVGNKILPPIASKIENELKTTIGDIFEFSPEYKSIQSGILQAQFGIRPSEANAKLKGLVTQLAQSTQVNFVQLKLRGNNIDGGFRIFAFKSDFSDILSMNEGFQTTNAGVNLHWLEWLLLEGDKVIISDYYFLPGSFPTSRSGGGIMVFNNAKYWRVPPQFSGVADNNWITRTVQAYIQDLEIIVEQAIRRAL
jgi:hypothetical protein